MKNPKIVAKQNKKSEWHFAQLGRNGKSVLIGGETFKHKPNKSKLERLARMFLASVLLKKIEYIPKKK